MQFVHCNASQTGFVHPDHQRFLDVLVAFDLVALNSWNSLGPTFIHNFAARIDFVMTRRNLADGPARDVKYLSDADFLTASHWGHAPMLFHIQDRYFDTHRTPKAGCTAADGHHIRMAWAMSAPQWHLATDSATQALDGIDGEGSDLIRDIHQCLWPSVHSLLNPLPKPAVDKSLIASKWFHHRKAKQSCIHLSSLFMGWKHAASYLKLERQCRQRAKSKAQAMLQDATQAARVNDAYNLYRVIRRYTPKLPPQRMQIRTNDGRLASIAEEAALLIAHVQNIKHQGYLVIGRMAGFVC